MSILRPFKALGYPILPVVPDCSYCAAMRFALLSAILTGGLEGAAMQHFVGGLVLGTAMGCFMVLSLYLLFKLTDKADDDGP